VQSVRTTHFNFFFTTFFTWTSARGTVTARLAATASAKVTVEKTPTRAGATPPFRPLAAQVNRGVAPARLRGDRAAFRSKGTTAMRNREENHTELLTVQEVAGLLKVPVSWVYGHTRKRSIDRLPGYRLGKYWRFRADEVMAWVQRQGRDHAAA